MDLEKIGKFIATLRKNKKLTQLQLANLIDASDKTISKWENGSFPDLAYQSKLCSALGIELDGLHAGELNLERRRRRKFRKIMSRIVAVYAAITIPLIIFLCFFFVNNYDSTKIYKVKTGDNYIEAFVNGMLIETNQLNMLYIGNINIFEYEIKSTDVVSVDIYSDSKVIFHSNKASDIIVKYGNDKKINKDNLLIKIEIQDAKEKIYKYEIKLDTTDISGDNPIKNYNMNKLELLSDKEIIENLKENGFVNHSEYLTKNTKKKQQEETITYLVTSKKLSYSSSNDTIIKNIILLPNNKFLEVYIYHKTDGEKVLFEKYTYNYVTEKLDCQVGVCSTLENVLETMERYVILLFGESSSTN